MLIHNAEQGFFLERAKFYNGPHSVTAVNLLIRSNEKCSLKDFSVTPSFRKETLLSFLQKVIRILISSLVLQKRIPSDRKRKGPDEVPWR